MRPLHKSSPLMVTLSLKSSEPAENLFRRIGHLPGAFWIDPGRSGSRASCGFMGCRPYSQLRIDSLEELDPALSLAKAIDQFMEVHLDKDRDPGASGVPWVVALFSYDLAALLELRSMTRLAPESRVPLAYLAAYDAILVLPEGSRPYSIVAHTASAAERLRKILSHDVAEPPRAIADPSKLDGTLVAAMAAAEHGSLLARAQRYIGAGDIYQVNLAQRIEIASSLSPVEAYLAFRAEQDVPFGAYLDCGTATILCASPERFLRRRQGTITTEPIKGTRPRGKSPADDARLQEELRSDPKERAEHIMIVDLERNDLGRICWPGSVRVPSLMRLESFATLHHLVSTVQGQLQDVPFSEILRATFPGGSVTGAPKIRAMQVIAELEPVPRGAYTGSLAWFAGLDHFDSTILIRTAVYSDGIFSYHSGGGIVADSQPQLEYEEIWLKARPILRALVRETGAGVPAKFMDREPQPSSPVDPAPLSTIPQSREDP
jgi:para-aminobenzoate synthetase component I